jgi:hypothetical protein
MARFNPLIDIEIDCSQGDHVVARTDDPTKNKLTMTLKNMGNVDLLWKAGKDADAGSIVIDFGYLLGRAEKQRVVIAMEGWTAEATATPPLLWILRPAADFILQRGRLLRFSMTIPAAGAQAKAGPHDLSVICRNVRDAANVSRIGSKVLDSFIVLVPSAGSGKSLASVVGCLIEPPGKVFCWEEWHSYLIDNKITLAISNLQSDAPLVAANATRGTTPPVFRIVFPVIKRPAEGDDPANSPSRKALTYVDHAKQIRLIGVESDNPAHPWTGRENPEELAWEVRAEPSGGPSERQNLEVLGPGAAVKVQIGPIRTPLPAFPSQLYIVYTDVPGYDDGYMTVPIWKEPPVAEILNFGTDRPQIAHGEDVTLNWETMGANGLEISYEDDDGRTVTLSSDGSKSNPALACPSGKLVLPRVTKTTTYTLTLIGGQGVSSPPQDDVTVTVEHATASLTVSPEDAALGDVVTVAWDVTGPWEFDGVLTSDKTLRDEEGKPLPHTIKTVSSADKPRTLKVIPTDTTRLTFKATSRTPAPLDLEVHADIKAVVQQVNYFRRVGPDTPVDLQKSGDSWMAESPVTLEWETAFASAVRLVAKPDTWSAANDAEAAKTTDEKAWSNDMTLSLERPDASGRPRRKLVKDLPKNGRIYVAPTQPTTFSLVCEGFAQQPLVSDVPVNVNAVVIRSFTANRQQGGSSDRALSVDWVGERVDFKISVERATSVRIEQSTMGATPIWSGENASDFQAGTQVLNNCVFTAVAEGPGGTVRWPISMTITKGPKVRWFKMAVSGDDPQNLEVDFNWATVGASLWRVGALPRTALPLRGVNTDHESIRFRISRDWTRDSGGEVPMDQMITGWMKWPWRNDAGYEQRLSQQFLDEHCFFLVAWEYNGNIPVVQLAERVESV